MRRLALDLRSWRAVYHLTQQQAADHAGVNQKTWRRWERDEQSPLPEKYREVRELLAQAPPGWVRGEP
jgi:transcriptional regulator with XRE-family HTH domain